MKIAAVVPAFNEAKMIGLVIEEIKDKVSEAIVIDDGSSDNTAEVAQQAGAIVIKHVINRGQGAALQTGIIFALSRNAEAIVTFDADGQFKAEEISEVVKPLLLGEFDVVLGSRFLSPANTVPSDKKLILKIATWATRLYTGLKLTDVHNGFRAFSKKAAEILEIRQDGMAHASEILEQIKKHNLKYCEVPVTVKYTDYSTGKGQKISNSLRIITDLLISRLSK